jgi:hypothetical protein
MYWAGGKQPAPLTPENDMTRTERPSKANRDGANTIILHRDSTVTMWSCQRQQWERGTPSDSDIAECCHSDADRIARHIA